ncbi:hypothetical protein Lal_00031494 [Lupinus albus]|nr:hypothetical protein Lal_00031494 [Lupinus albus]
MRVQPRCIARTHVVYLKQVDLLDSLMLQSSCRFAPFLLGPHRQNKSNCLFCILYLVPLQPRALRNRTDHIDISLTQLRSLKGSRRPTKARKS